MAAKVTDQKALDPFYLGSKCPRHLDLLHVVSASETLGVWSRKRETRTSRGSITLRFDLSLISPEFLEVSPSDCDPKLIAVAWISELGRVKADLLSTQAETRAEVC